jgi:hypothetical protein
MGVLAKEIGPMTLRTGFAPVAAVALCFLAGGPSGAQRRTQPGSPQDAVMKVDEEYRIAKLKNDIAALSRILADNFYETNQNGNSRNKAQSIELWTDFRITSLTTDSYDVRITGDTATVTGTQTEVNAGVDRMLFTRVYVKGSSGWQLLSSMQFRNPDAAPSSARRPFDSGTPEDAVMRVDDEFRIAKLKRDTAALNRILAADYHGTNQYGHNRNKEQCIELFSYFEIASLTTDSYQVRITGDTAVVSGRQTEVNGAGVERMLFTRVYVKVSGAWQLLSSTQFLDG